MIYITRHGQTDWNIKHKVQGKADIELNAVGKKQAIEVGKKLLAEKIDLIICSPLKRAKQTANLISEGRNIPIIYDENISERDFGEFEGKIKEDFDFNDFWSYKKNIKYKKAENIRNFFDRIYLFLDEVIEKYPNKNILLVTHGGVSIPVKCYFNGIPEDDNLLALALSNCEYFKYSRKNCDYDDSQIGTINSK